MLGEEKRSVINVNLKKYPKHTQHPVTDLKMELLVFAGSEFASDYHKSNVSYEQQKSYITVFWNGGSYYLAEILLVQSQQ